MAKLFKSVLIVHKAQANTRQQDIATFLSTNFFIKMTQYKRMNSKSKRTSEKLIKI